MAKLTYIKASAVRRHCNARNRRVTPQFLRLGDSLVARKLNAACDVHNGGRTTLDAVVAGHVGIQALTSRTPGQ